MQPRSAFTFSCPSCGARGQSFRAFSSLERVTSTKCSSCGTELVSKFGEVKYGLFFLYTQIAAAPIGIFLLAGLLTARWFWAAGALAAGILFVWLPAMALHSKNVTVKVIETRPRRYGRKHQND